MLMRLLILFIASFIFSFILAKILIPLLKKLRFGQEVRSDGPEKHLSKQGTPTMGGIIFILGTLITVFAEHLLYKDLDTSYIIFASISMVAFAGIGFLDDFIKIVKKRSLGLRAYQKIIAQFVVSALLSFWAYSMPSVGASLFIPWSNASLNLSIFYIPIVIVVIIAIVNSVNLTDGLDGLSASITMIDVITYAAIFYISISRFNLSSYDSDLYFSMSLFAVAFAGSLLAYLCFNVYPARVFMGDTGSFALGGALAAMAILSRSILIIPIIGMVFVLSSVSVILQVGSYKLRNKKRIFLMAPLHHHFELKGYPETKVVEAYRIVTILMCILALTAYAK